MVNGELPDDWKQTTIGEALKIVRGISFPKDAKTFEQKKGYIACLRTTNVQQEVEWDDLWFVPTENVKREEQLIQPNDILISTANSLELVGKVAQIKAIPHKATLGAFISLIRVPAELDPKFVYFQLASTKVQSAIRRKASTTTNISNISTSKLAEIDFGFPSLPQQERIVAKIEELFTQLEAGTSALERVQLGLRRYKASVLKAAVEGKLGIQNDEFRIGEGELPEGWTWTTTGDLCDSIVPNRDKPKSFTGDIPWITLPDFSENIEIRESKSGLGLSEEEVKKYRARVIPAGSVVMSCIGRFGITAMATRNIVVNQQLHAFLVDKDILDAHYLAYAIRTQIPYMEKIATATTIAYLNKENCNSVPIPLPPLEEQRRIVAEVERRLSVAREVESVVEKALVRAARLRQSVLRSAFEGRLV